MQCSLCDKIALRVAGVGKKQKGFCGEHKQEAYDYEASFSKSRDKGHYDHTFETNRNTFNLESIWR